MIEYKKASIKDISKIQDVAKKTWPNTFGELMASEQIEYMLDNIYSYDALEEQIERLNQQFILIYYKSELCGFSSYELNYKKQAQLMIHKVYLLPNSQGKGIGKSLFNYLENIATAHALKKLMLKVFYKNTNAIGFYLKKNFVNQGIEITDIGNGYKIKDNVMVKTLT